MQSWRNRHFQLSDRGAFLALRWLVFLGLLMLSLYNGIAAAPARPIGIALAISLVYGLSNLAMTFSKRFGRLSGGGAALLFGVDLALIGSALYSSIGIDPDLY